jgi:hypothetical protein
VLNSGTIMAENIASHSLDASAEVTIPPLGAVFLVRD